MGKYSSGIEQRAKKLTSGQSMQPGTIKYCMTGNTPERR
jgi:hypothetical protein